MSGRLGRWLLPATALIAIAVELVARYAMTAPGWLGTFGRVALVVCGAPILLRTLAGIVRGRFAADIVASLAILAAIVLDQPLAGLVIVLMQSGGEALEEYAGGRASRAVRELEAAAPRQAHRLTGTGSPGGVAGIEEIAVEDIAVGDRLLVRPGEMIPCDADVVEGHSHLDTASLTGEPVPRRVGPGAHLLSGSLNQESPLTVQATAPAGESQYAKIVELVRGAQASKAPLQRLADRYAIWFTPLTLIVAFAAYLLSHDPVRVLAVLVVATPCPLILATPVAIIGGINRAARHRVVFRNGTALEQIGGVDTVVFDKTGTLTIGRPVVAEVIVAPRFERAHVLRLAGSVEQGSSHLLARTLVEAVHGEEPALPVAEHVVEEAGRGIRGEVDGHGVLVGARAYVEAGAPGSTAGFQALDGRGPGLRAYVAVDGAAAGIVEYADQPRAEAGAVLAELAALGVRRTLLLSGDATANATALAHELGIAEARGDLLAEDKVAAVQALMQGGHRVLMVGDGTNDAPALGTATVGMALAGSGGGITAEAADVVLLAEDLRLLPLAIGISRRTLHIARQSIWVGLGLSGAAMLVAAGGAIPPTAGALLQEAIDVAVILNALRTSIGGRD